MIILVILWTCVGVFVATAAISLLGLTGKIELPRKYMNILFSTLIVEVVGISVGMFSGQIDPSYIADRVRDTGEKEAYAKIQEEISTITTKVEEKIKDKEYDSATEDLRLVFDEILGSKISAVSDVFYLKGLLAERRELWATAASNYDTALQIKPDNPDVLIRAARAKLKQS